MREFGGVVELGWLRGLADLRDLRELVEWKATLGIQLQSLAAQCSTPATCAGALYKGNATCTNTLYTCPRLSHFPARASRRSYRVPIHNPLGDICRHDVLSHCKFLHPSIPSSCCRMASTAVQCSLTSISAPTPKSSRLDMCKAVLWGCRP